ncbi:MAG: methylmalonyl-CoA epimerase [Acidobacteria bacterium]|nr:MAG: methylmalonyl-CoA epimerase [Acidobacteriota bacterium]
MYRKIDHIGIAVRSLAEAVERYRKLGTEVGDIEEVPDQRTRVALLRVGESRIELLEAMQEDSPVGKFLARRGEGLHHICLATDDVALELDRLRRAGVRLIDDAPRRGAGGCLVAFVHPSSAGGVLIELSQAPAQPGAQHGEH